MRDIRNTIQRLRQHAERPSLNILDIDVMLDEVKALYIQLLNEHALLAERKSPAAPAFAIRQDEFIPSNEEQIVELPKEIRSLESREWPTISEPAAADMATPAYQEPAQFQPAHHKPKHDIRGLISINDKYQFISELFRNDKETYEQTLTEINGLEGEEQAMEYLNFSVSDAYDWNDSSTTVQMFYKLLGEFFSRR